MIVAYHDVLQKGSATMPTTTPNSARENSLYSVQDLSAINAQINRRWVILLAPCAVLAALIVLSLILRLEWLTSLCTILIGGALIGGYDLFIKPLVCYRRHLNNALYGRVHEVELPFVALSEDESLVDGVTCRALTCLDYDGKGRPYDRLFYFDALKTLPDFQPEEVIRVVHHDLMVADVTRA